MMSAESASAQKESEPTRHETATASPEAASVGGGGSVVVAEWFGHELFSQPANSGVRALAMRRAQQTYGNRHVQRMLSRPTDKLSTVRSIQRQCACGGTCSACKAEEASVAVATPKGAESSQVAGDEHHLIQPKGSAGAPPETMASVDLFPAGGEPLDRQTRGMMESSFGSDLGDVRVHTDSRAAASALSIGADAYTSGQDIYFGAGRFAPATHEGQHLLAHELAHTLQQGDGETPVAASGTGDVLIGSAEDPLEVEAEQAADTVVNGGSAASAVSKDGSHAVRRDLSSIAGEVWDATGGHVVDAAEYVGGKLEDLGVAVIERVAPGVLTLLRGAGAFLYDKITAGIDNLFGGIASRVQKQGVMGAITEMLGSIAGSIGKSLGGLVAGTCHSMVEAASAVVGFVKQLSGEAFAELGRIAGAVGDFFSELWDDLGAPALAAIKKVAGEAWSWIVDKAQWVWNKLLPVRNTLGRAWDWLKKEFNIAKDGAEGFLDSLYDKAKEQWMKVRDKIAPILGPLKLVAGALLLLSPLGPIILIWKGAPYLWHALEWIWANGIKPVTEKIRAEFREHILPYILQGIDAIGAKLDEASAFLCGHAGTISAGLHTLQGALAAVPVLRLASSMVGLVAGFFDNLAAKGKCKFSDVIGVVKAGLRRIYEFVKPVLEVLRQFAMIALLGPWAILDDGVWSTMNWLVGMARKTPCIREIAGLLHVDGAMAKVGEIRAVLKDVWEVVSNEQRFEAEIHKRLDGMLTMIPGKATSILGGMLGLDGPHLDALLRRFLFPKIAQFVARAPAMLIDMVWGLVWPWPGVMAECTEIGKQIDKLKASLWDFEFSKAADAGLAIWRGLNGIVGLLYGWFFLAAVLIGAVFGAPQAGAAVAYEVGEVLLVATLLAEGLSIEKARLNLMSRSRLAKPEEQRAQEDDEDYKTIADSTMNLAILGVMAVLGELAVDFAKAVFSELKSIFLPRGAEVPKVELPAGRPAEAVPEGAPHAEGQPAPKEAPTRPAETPPEPVKEVPEDAAAKAEEKGVPRQQFEAEVGELRQKASNPENVHEPNKPGRDAQMDAGEHQYERNESDQSWCRHSAPPEVCGLDVGPDLNAKVDEALQDKAVDAPSAADKPASAADTPPGEAVEEPAQGQEPAEALPPDQVRRYDRYARQQRAKGKEPLKPGEWYEKIGKKPPRNKYGKTGDPAHVTEVARLAEKARAEFRDDIIHQGTSIKKKTGVSRQPDVWVEDVQTGQVKKVYEAARTNPDGSFVDREQLKMNDYDNAGIPHEFGNAGPVKAK